MPQPKLTLACRDYDHTRALRDRSVAVDGAELEVLCITPPSQIFLRMLRNEEFDLSEMSLSNYLISLGRGDTRFVGLPVFPSRIFRHSYIWINSNSGIQEPRDLIGKRVGIADYSMTALLFARGMLKHQYGVLPEDLHWLRTRAEHVPVRIPPGIRVEDLGKGRKLDQALEEGQIDAMISTYLPPGAANESPAIRRLFPNARDTEAEYFRQTGIYPIMHLVVMRRAAYEQHRGLAAGLTQAFQEAKKQTLNRADEGLYPLPWAILDMEYARRLMGRDIYPYGVKSNLPTLQAATLFSYEQGLTDRRIEVEQLFAPETLKMFEQD